MNTNNLEKTLLAIESLESVWEYTLTIDEDTNHSYGRVPEDDNKVAFWSIPRSTGKFLNYLVKFTRSKNVLELGTSVGYSTLFLADAVRTTGGHVYGTEILPAKIQIAKDNFKQSGLSDYITLYTKEINLVLKSWNKKEKIDFVFMDADKEKYLDYLDMLLPLMADNALIVVDNAGKVRMANGSLINSKHILKFREDVANYKGIISSFLDVDNGLLLISKSRIF